jgi:ABC-type transport system substrate-binding protein
MKQMHLLRIVMLLMVSAVAAFAITACSSSDPEVLIQTVVVEKEVKVKGDTVEVIKEVTVKGDTVIQTVVVEEEVEVKGDTIEVIKEVEVEVKGDTVVRIVEVEAKAAPVAETFFGLPMPVVPDNVGTAPQPDSADGTVVVRGGLELRGSGVPGDSSGGMFTSQSVTEKLFMTDEGGNAVGLVAESWDLAADLSKLTINLKQGVQFHGGYGELTAADVAWSLNMGNPGFNPESATDGGSNWISFIGDQEVLATDTYTVEIPIATFDPRWATFILGQSGLGLSITSKKAFDDEGESWVRDNVIGTGPFEVVKYSRDDVLELSAVQDHHRITPSIDKYILRAIPDDAVAEAALQTGAVDVSQVALRNMTGLQKAGFEVVGAGAGSFHSISFSGNYWERTHFVTGEDLGANFTVRHSLPWVGDPERPDFGNPPEGMTNMERARLVRTALSHAIDRELISEVLFAGAAWPNYVYGADINNPNWQDKWTTEYDQKLAGDLLDQAGYPLVDGVRFELPFFIRIGRGDEEIGTAVVGMWREIGIDVQDWKAQYQTYRPNLIGRTATAPWIHSAGAESPQAPWDWPVMGNSECSRGRGGFNIAIEIRELCQFYDDMSKEGDVTVRNELRNEVVDYLAHWMPVIGTVAAPQVALVNPNKIASWDMPLSVREAALHHPEFITLK